MALTPLPTPPSRSRPATFSAEADAFLNALPTLVSEYNASTAGESAAALAVNLASTASGNGASLVGIHDAGGLFSATDTEGALQEVGVLWVFGAINIDAPKYLSLQSGNDITAAMTVAIATGNCVYVPYKATRRLMTAGVTFANNNQIVFGDGPGSNIQFNPGSGAGYLGVMFNADGKTGCGIRNLKLDGPEVTVNIANSYTQSAFRGLSAATDCFVRECAFGGWAGGVVFFQDAVNCQVNGNTFHSAQCMPLASDNFGTADCTFWGSCVDCRFEGNMSDSGASYGAIVQTISGPTQTARRNKIRGNTIVGSKNYGVLVYNYSNGTPPVVNNIYDTEVSGNTIRDVYGFYNNPASGLKDYGAGIYVLSAENTQVVGNNIKNCCINTAGSTLTPAGIAINGTTKAQVLGNTVEISAQHGIYVVDTLQLGAGASAGSSSFVPSGYVIVSGNNITDCDKHGILIQNKHKVKCYGNAVNNINGTLQAGVCTDTTVANYPTLKWISIDDNDIYDTTGYGVLTEQTAYGSVSYNRIDGVGGVMTTGIFGDTIDCTLHGNVINAVTGGSGRAFDMRSTGTNCVMEGNRATGCTVGMVAGQRIMFGDGNDFTGCTTKWSGTYAKFQSSAPAAGTWVVDDRVRRLPAAVGSPKAWVCTVAGTPGTWVSEGNL